MNRRLKLGIIGAGGIFKHAHLQAWEENEDVEFYAVCDPNKEQAQSLSEQLGVDLVYDDYKELLKNDEIDIVDICTPNVFHSEIAILALQAGKHVLVEKPDAINPEEADKMVAAAQESEKVLMTFRNNRFRPVSQFLKQYIENGNAGEIYTGRCGWVRRRGIPQKAGFTTKALSGGGPLIDLGVHFIDLAIWLMGNPRPVSVVGATYNKFATNKDFNNTSFDVEDLATGFIRFDNGATLQIEFSWASHVEEQKNFLELRGTKAGIDFSNSTLKLFTVIEGQDCDIYPRLDSGTGGGHTENIHHFVDCVQKRTQPLYTPEDGVHMIKILSAIYESAEKGCEIKL
ncbi:Gfo/Idh/MocA family protein [Alkalihalobacillus sp. 1P02AB]|uniref:Gfo/Idh/MocA family protein n=1 Tax=Alkalihalobacillus sp. 1P02AB TaxID=3132260 RepID=UPI0039A7626F